jgi:CheY-like chemotaxis protein
MMNDHGIALVSSDAYNVACPSCAAVSDVSRTPWCGCLGKDRTPRCASCGACFCRLSPAQRLAFWSAAPASLHERRRVEARSRLAGVPVDEKAPLVMLVDDDEEIRAIGAHTISRLGFRCTIASDGAEALALMTLEEPAVVITDALMPRMDGWELCRFVKRTSMAKVIMMTSLYTGRRYRNEALGRYGADDYLAKPIDVAALQASLSRLAPAGRVAA